MNAIVLSTFNEQRQFLVIILLWDFLRDMRDCLVVFHVTVAASKLFL